MRQLLRQSGGLNYEPGSEKRNPREWKEFRKAIREEKKRKVKWAAREVDL